MGNVWEIMIKVGTTCGREKTSGGVRSAMGVLCRVGSLGNLKRKRFTACEP